MVNLFCPLQGFGGVESVHLDVSTTESFSLSGPGDVENKVQLLYVLESKGPERMGRWNLSAYGGEMEQNFAFRRQLQFRGVSTCPPRKSTRILCAFPLEAGNPAQHRPWSQDRGYPRNGARSGVPIGYRAEQAQDHLILCKYLP